MNDDYNLNFKNLNTLSDFSFPKRSHRQHITKFILFVSVMFFAFLPRVKVFGQNQNFLSNWYFSPSIGFSQFYGDISNHSFFQKLKGETTFSGDFTGRKMFSPVFGAGLNIYYTGLKSHKTQMGNNSSVDLQLTGHYFDFNFRGYLDFVNLFDGYNSHRNFSLIGSLGIGSGFWKTTLVDNNTGISLGSGQLIGGTKYKSNAFVVPVGLETTYRFAEHWTANLGMDFRTVLNDDVDVWHDGFKYDQIMYVKIGVTYSINSGWGRRVTKPTTKGEEYGEKEKQPIAVIPLYGYRPENKNRKNVSVQPEPETMTIAPPKPIRMPIPATHPQGVEFRVQIMAKAQRKADAEQLRIKYNLDYPVVEHFQNGLYLYSIGSFSSYQAALAESRKIRAEGVFYDAFVVSYQNGQRIPLTKQMKK